MPQLTVDEASVAYIRSMRNVLPASDGICTTCHTFIGPTYSTCYQCQHQANHLDAVVPISYSEHLGQLHTALRGYKDGEPAVQRYARPRIAAILWRFLSAHEQCVANNAGVASFDMVTTVPSSSPDQDEKRDGLRAIVGWCKPVSDRFERVLLATGAAPPGRAFSRERYRAVRSIGGTRVLLIDDTWTAGGHAQSAAYALQDAGAEAVALVVLGRHLRPEWAVTSEKTSGDLFRSLPRFSWDTCAVH